MKEAKPDSEKGIEISGKAVPKPLIDPDNKVLESLVDFLNKSEQITLSNEKPTEDNSEDKQSDNSRI